MHKQIIYKLFLKKNFRIKLKGKIKRDEEFYTKEILLLKDIDWVRFMAEKIDKDNNQLNQKLKDLQIKNFVDESEKKYLIE